MGSKSARSSVLPESRRPADIEKITRSYSTEIGRGAYGIVYKGTDKDGKDIAVKVLQERTGGNHDEEFNKEFYSLLELRHQNIILLVGYCYETEKRINNLTKKFDEIVKAALCFEYAPNGNLRNYISDEGRQLDWHTCYKIIKGTCEGLHYLHHHPTGPIYHLDLKPENILLSGDMVPKIADFGMSRLFSDKTTKVSTSPIGTWRYQPLEYKKGGTISKEFDIYSLGVIMIEMVVGPKTYDNFDDFSLEETIVHAEKKWRPKLKETETYQSLEAYCQQVKKCLEIGLTCVEANRRRRPTIAHIISQLNEVEIKTLNRNSVFQESRKGSGKSTQQAQSMPHTWAAGSSREQHRATTQIAQKKVNSENTRPEESLAYNPPAAINNAAKANSKCFSSSQGHIHMSFSTKRGHRGHQCRLIQAFYTGPSNCLARPCWFLNRHDGWRGAGARLSTVQPCKLSATTISFVPRDDAATKTARTVYLGRHGRPR
ncbi:putative receptor-like protein kinase At4g00960 isoform X3 [Brachypodium distachyon]|uniref:Protein kinase domain-containing protein n=1 Tax=Brachypodium distachyon TaxID=15368 RepID=A0A2K2CMY6_BRADI|nr:putative receptor-like protein kinase At4g00960 isoform X3 [Brachypodium distachyon]PNT63389.1 hypothetical protein BRADI_4g15043v3 [Brachypodium distachyon]|eukprot:XP_024319405.1 putative receptor-like protein kinase At4g00960 isoform X3 [Brachypodium distachyon]